MSLALRTWVIATVLVISGACSSTAPRVKVLGVSESRAHTARPPVRERERTLLVFLEVINPTGLALELSRLEYHFNAESWFSTDGAIALSRAVGADSAAVVEVPVRISSRDIPADALRVDEDGNLIFSLQGRLFARAGELERSWNVEVRGTLRAESLPGAGRDTGPHVRVHLARHGQETAPPAR